MSTGTERWLRRQGAREARIVTLEQGLLGGRLWRYAAYRLRFFAVNWLVASLAHAVLAIVLLRSFGMAGLVSVVAAHGAVLLVAQFWWGALEAQRSRVRDLHRAARPHRVPPVIASWVSLGLAAGSVLLVLAVAWVLACGTGVAQLYVAALVVGLAVELPVRAYHSGVYAVRRVRLPLAATLAPQLAGPAVLLLLVGWPYAPVVAVLVTTGLAGAATVYWTRRLQHFLGVRLRGALGWRAARACAPAWRESLAAGSANAAIGLDGLVVLALVAGARPGVAGAVSAIFLVLPTVAAGAEWARLLYFDLKRLELRLFANLRRRFERFTAWLAVVLGAAFGTAAAAVVALVERAGPAELAALCAFFVARSVLARAQIQAFAGGAYAVVAATGVLCAAGVLAVGSAASATAVLLGGVAVVAAVCAGTLAALLHGHAGPRWLRRGPASALLTLEWLHALGRVRTPVVVGSAALVPARGLERLDARSRADASRWRLAQLADRVARRVGHDGAAAWIAPDRVVWFVRVAAPDGRPDGEWLQRASGGQVRRVRTATCPDGEQALWHAARTGLLGAAGEHLSTAILPVDGAEAGRAFTAAVPGGLVYVPGRGPSTLGTLAARELRAVLADATAFARDLQVRRPRSRHAVTPLCAGGALEYVFVADRTAGRRAIAAWNKRVTALNLRAAVAGLRIPPGRRLP